MANRSSIDQNFTLSQNNEQNNETAFIDLYASVNQLPCVKCNSKEKGNMCMRIENTIYLSNCRSIFGQCYTTIIDGIVHRGCVGDDKFPDEASTADPPYPTIVCNDNRLCNQDRIEDTCIGCTGKTCTKPTLEMEKACSLKPSTATGCYLRIQKNGIYERGCLQGLTPDEQIKCANIGASSCQSCFSQNCNQKAELYQTCNFCNGTRDRECHLPRDSAIAINCIGYSSRCLVGVDANGYAHRQCSSLDSETDTLRFPNGFELCDENRCNHELFPKNWTKCFKCQEDERCDHPSATLVPEPCKLYHDQCFTYGIEGIS